MDEMLPLKAQEFSQLVGNWFLLDKSWAGTGVSLVLVRLEGEVVSRHAAGWDLTLPQKTKLPSGLGSQYREEHPWIVCEEISDPCFVCEEILDPWFVCEQILDPCFVCEQVFVVSQQPHLSQ